MKDGRRLVMEDEPPPAGGKTQYDLLIAAATADAAAIREPQGDRAP
jgi:hypothetical protein